MEKLIIDISGVNGLVERYQGDLNDTASQPHLRYLGASGQFAEGFFNPIKKLGYLSPANNTFLDISGTSFTGNITDMMYDADSDSLFVSELSNSIWKMDGLDATALTTYTTLDSGDQVLDLQLYELDDYASLYYLVKSEDYLYVGVKNIDEQASQDIGNYEFTAVELDTYLTRAVYSTNFIAGGEVLFTMDGRYIEVYYLQSGKGYDISTATRSTEFDTNTQTNGLAANQMHIKPDNTKIFVSANVGTGTVFVYNLNTGTNPYTITYSGISFVHGLGTAGVSFNNDGTKMYLLRYYGANDGDLVEYALGTAWDVTTATVTATEDIAALIITGTDDASLTSIEVASSFVFNSTGTKLRALFFSATTSSNIGVYEFDLSTPFNITSISFNNKRFRTRGNATESSYDTGIPNSLGFGLAFSSDEKYMFLAHGNVGGSFTKQPTIYQFTKPFSEYKKWSLENAEGFFREEKINEKTFLYLSENNLVYWVVGRRVHLIDGSSTSTLTGRILQNVLLVPSYMVITDIAETRSRMYIGVQTSNQVSSDNRTFNAHRVGVFIWDKRTQIIGSNDYYPAPGAKEIKNVFVSYSGDVFILTVNNSGFTELRALSGNQYEVVQTLGKNAFPAAREGFTQIGPLTVWLGSDGTYYAFGPVFPGKTPQLFKIGSISSHAGANFEVGPILLGNESSPQNMIVLSGLKKNDNSRKIVRWQVNGEGSGQLAHPGNIYTLVYDFPTPVKVEWAHLFGLPVTSAATTVAILKVYFNRSSTADQTYTLTQKNFANGYFYIPHGRKNVTSIQYEIEYPTNHTITANSFQGIRFVVEFNPLVVKKK